VSSDVVRGDLRDTKLVKNLLKSAEHATICGVNGFQNLNI
jgi:hypothetical protein